MGKFGVTETSYFSSGIVAFEVKNSRINERLR
jgi:hypothetical protein